MVYVFHLLLTLSQLMSQTEIIVVVIIAEDQHAPFEILMMKDGINLIY